MGQPAEVTALAQVQATLSEVMRRLDLLVAVQEADLTITAFAKKANLSRTTIYQKIRKHRILTRNGRIPHSELRKFVS